MTAGGEAASETRTTPEARSSAAATAALQFELGNNDFRVSNMGTDGDTALDASEPAIAYNSTNNQYLVVWHGDDDTLAAAEEFEIFGQRIGASGAEIGSDFRISHAGPDGDTGFGVFSPDVAYNSTNNEYLVVWEGDDAVDGERQVFGQRINAATGSLVGSQIDISAMGPEDTTDYVARDPAVAYNSTNNLYLVVWDGDDDTLAVNDEFEVFGQLVNASNGTLVGGNFRISNMGPDGNTSFLADSVDVAYNATRNEFLVVWSAEDDTGDLVDLEREIYGQRINATNGAQIAPDDFRISDMGTDGDILLDADDPAVAYSSSNDQYLVVWRGDDDTGALVDNEVEIFGQRVDGTGVEVGVNDFRISEMGPDGNAAFDAFAPAVAYSAEINEYLVVWLGDDGTPPMVDNEREIFAQRVSAATGEEIGINDLRISDMGPDGNVAFSVDSPDVAANSADVEFVAVWSGEEADDEFEIYGQRLLSSLLEFFIGGLPLSPDGNPTGAGGSR